jgi:3-oxoacyl-[acyl-carrier-protein] synthase III
MEGRAVFRWATTRMPDLCRRACDAAGVALEDLKAFVPHQANERITDSVVAKLGLPESVAIARDVRDSGNTSAASVPLALDRLVELGQVGSGDAALLVGFGAGLTAAAQVVHVP